MARMTREFSLVLLGAGVLTAGSFLWPEENLEAVANEQADKRVAATGSRGYRSGFPMFLWLHTSRAGMGAGRTLSPARVGLTRGGFGGVGARISGVS
ncbi:MAG: hypothetical protein IT429_15030 [Gemmataceae bacterium]|nr:hypothetical protein [Gemmataceae bacterium]